MSAQHVSTVQHVGTQHAMVATATLELVGRVLMGLDTDVNQL